MTFIKQLFNSKEKSRSNEKQKKVVHFFQLVSRIESIN